MLGIKLWANEMEHVNREFPTSNSNHTVRIEAVRPFLWLCGVSCWPVDSSFGGTQSQSL
jgi:hypothetical protein